MRRTLAAMAAVAVLAGLGAGPAGAASSWTLHGAGWGHGIGMSQYGAMEMAKDGYSAKEILAHYYTGTTYDAVKDDQVLNVNLQHAVKSTTLTAVPKATGGTAGPLTIDVIGSATRTTTVQPDGVVTITNNGAGVAVTCTSCSPYTSLAGDRAETTWGSSTLVNVAGTRYDTGRIVATVTNAGTNSPSKTTIEVVNQVRLHDQYLDHIRESPWSWPAEALKAQAAAARGYALSKYNAGLRSSCSCHVYDTTADQVYGGYPSTSDLQFWKNWQTAVRATGSSSTGYVARYQSTIISAYYSSSSGGRTENNEDVWAGTALPYLRGVSDPWSLRASNPNRAWRQVASAGSVASAFNLPDVARLDLRDRTANGGVKTATATSSSGQTKTVRGDALRTISTDRGNVKSTMIAHPTRRISGPDRYASAAAVAATISSSASAVVVAGADGPLADASVSGPLAATLAAPLLLTRKADLPAPTVAELNRRGSTVKTAYLVGGPGAVSDQVAKALTARGLTVQRLAGPDRYSTSVEVAKAIRARRTVTAAVVAGGSGVADALGVSGPAAARGEPILLTPADGLGAATRAGLVATGATTVRVVGGTAVVSVAVETDLAAAGFTSRRLGGDDRYAVSGAVVAFYRGLVPSTTDVVLTSGADTALVDSLVAGTLKRLMVLTKRNSLPEPAAASLQSTPNLDLITVVGGTGSVPNATVQLAARS